MNTLATKTVFVSALIALSTLSVTGKVNAQEAALVYATNVSATQSLNDIATKVSPQMLARDYSRELIAEMDERLPGEHADDAEALRLRNDFNDSLIEDLDVRLKEEIHSLTVGLAD